MYSDQYFQTALTQQTLRQVFQVALVCLAMLGTCAHSAGMTETEMIRQLSAKSPAAVEHDDPNAAFANDGLQTRNLARVRVPDTSGACLADSSAQANTKTLVVIALPPAGSPQVTLPLQFAHASYELSPIDMQQLVILARAMRSTTLRNARFTIAGHTDASGDPLVNEKLSCARALAARTYLIAQGVAPARLGAYGFGSSRPIEVGAVQSAENRRVEVRRVED